MQREVTITVLALALALKDGNDSFGITLWVKPPK
jgi:hypothetical protein